MYVINNHDISIDVTSDFKLFYFDTFKNICLNGLRVVWSKIEIHYRPLKPV